MKLSRLALAAVVLAAMAAPAPAQQPPDATGKWVVTTTTPNGPISAALGLKKEGDKLSGTISGPQGGEVPVSGTQKDASVELTFTMQTQNGPIDVAMSGKQDGDAMSGTLDAGQRGQMDWTAKREGGAPPAQGAPGQEKPEKLDITGAWLFEVSSEVSSGTRNVVFKQDGETVTGTYSGQYGDSALTGTLKGKDLVFGFRIMAEGTSVDITYRGVVEKDTIKGTFSIGDMGEGSFTAKRKQ